MHRNTHKEFSHANQIKQNINCVILKKALGANACETQVLYCRIPIMRTAA